ncbi:PQQ-dependent sugar dehydrogenase [Hydrogenophaga sp. BPS33]|uniref:PQQ-dependent sugar dehydrogenase n=1 Tax=Hydrogenophaga sp. BPS33 TaxID=2651974 RepID=UPI00131FF4EE|nr:PQQ-dependent sugar dehydrogenase [Hydrogenophaga sp. BPS33]QHE86866.1 PQQ-dependent sugar dehydrogenase [Hydrogenophaga sp. BPS33]
MRAYSPPFALLAVLSLSLALVAACGGGDGESKGPAAPVFVPTTGSVAVTELATGLPNPWSLAFLPDRRMLVTGRLGNLRLYTADGLSFNNINLAGLSNLSTTGQGGLLDVVVDPAFASNRRIYVSFAESDTGNPTLNGTAVARAELDTGALTLVGWQVIYRQTPKVARTAHFGSRLVFDRDGHLFVTLGDRESADQRVFAQDVSRGNGKIVRITTDGNPAPGNPVIAGGMTGLWSYGHRNPQGAALHPETGELWTNEHGPQGGDEINRTLAARNYGWPVISYGQEYGTTTQVGEGTAKAGMEQPVAYWEKSDGSAWTGGQKSSIAPSGMAFFTGNIPANWNGSVFVGALAGTALWRLKFDGTREAGRERLLATRNERIRDVRQGPDGRLYLLTDGASGKLLRIGG